VAQYGERVKPVYAGSAREVARGSRAVAVDTFVDWMFWPTMPRYGQFAPFEQMSAEDFKAIVDTCFYGVVTPTRAAVPVDA